MELNGRRPVRRLDLLLLKNDLAWWRWSIYFKVTMFIPLDKKEKNMECIKFKYIFYA